MQTLSLQGKVQHERKKYSDVVDRWNDLNEQEATDLRNRILKDFKSEQTEIWAAAALELGRLAAQDEVAEGYLQEFMLAVDNKHRRRHAFTALGAYACSLEEDRELVFLSRYCQQDGENFNFQELKQKILDTEWGTENSDTLFSEWGLRKSLVKSTHNTDAVRDYVDSNSPNDVKNFECKTGYARRIVIDLLKELSGADTEELGRHKNEPFSQVLVNVEAVRVWWEEQGKPKLKSDILNKQQVYENNPNEGVKSDLDCLEDLQRRMDHEDKELTLLDVLEKTENSAETICAYNRVLSVNQLDEWGGASFVLSLPELTNVCRDEVSLAGVLRGLICKGRTGYVKNVPFVILAEPDEQGIEEVAEDLISALKSNLIERKDNIHLHEFLQDVWAMMERMSGKQSKKGKESAGGRFFELLKDLKIFPAEYIERVNEILQMKSSDNPARHTAILVNQIIETFDSQQRWRALPPEMQNLVNLIPMLFDAYVGRTKGKNDKQYEYVLSEERKDELLIDALKERLPDNSDLAVVLLRIVKERFYRRLESVQDKREVVHAECLRQFYVVADILRGWNWRGMVYKDTATIMVRLFEKAYKFEQLSNSSDRPLTRKLFYFLFYQYPEKDFLKGMHDYLTNEDCSLFFQNLQDLWDSLNEAKQSVHEGLVDVDVDRLWKKYERIARWLWPNSPTDTGPRNHSAISVWWKPGESDRGGFYPTFDNILEYRTEFEYFSNRGIGSIEMSTEERQEFSHVREVETEETSHRFREINLELEEKRKAFDSSFDSYTKFLESEGLYENTLYLCNDALKAVNDHLPLIERDLLYISLTLFKKQLKKEEKAVNHLLETFKSGNDEAAERVLDLESAIHSDSSQSDTNERLCNRIMNDYRVGNKVSDGESGGVSTPVQGSSDQVEGRTLREELKSFKLSEHKALEYTEAIATALDHEWRKKCVLHRDIKPENIMIKDSGEPVLLNFRVVRKTKNDESLPCAVSSTHHYMSPEQVNGETTPGPGTDMFSLGVVLYEMLTGETPFHGKRMRMQTEETQRSVKELKPKVSQSTCALVDRLLKKNPEERYRSWSDVLQDIRKAQNPVASVFWKPGKEEKQEKVIALVEQFMYHRVMLRDLAQHRQTLLKNGVTAAALTKLKAFYYRVYQGVLNLWVVLGLIAFPFVVTALNTSIGTAVFGVYLILVQFAMIVALCAFIGFGIRSLFRRYKSADSQKQSINRMGFFDLLLPKVLGILFIAYPSMFFSDEMWSISSGENKLVFTVGMSCLIIFVSYLFIKHTMLGHVQVETTRSRRGRQILALGLLESFLITTFYTVKIGSVMASEYRGLTETFGKAAFGVFPARVSFGLGDKINLPAWFESVISLNFDICPWLVLGWTVKIFFAGVVLQMFLAKDRIIEAK